MVERTVVICRGVVGFSLAVVSATVVIASGVVSPEVNPDESSTSGNKLVLIKSHIKIIVVNLNFLQLRSCALDVCKFQLRFTYYNF